MNTVENKLIELLPRIDRARLTKLCTPVHLSLSQVLGVAGEASSFVYFPTQGFISMIAHAPNFRGVEVGMIGDEGMVGSHIAMGASSSTLSALVNCEGEALSLPVKAFKDELARSSALTRAIHQYLSVLMEQLTQTAACLRFHLIQQRLARWLLMNQDRSHSDALYVTQEFLASVLGVRRVGVTAAAGELQRSGLIRYVRGELQVLDRAGLEKAACSCYQHDRQCYASRFP